MKQRARGLVAAAFVSLLASPVPIWAQGALTPPGPPAPTMKTLAQIEPRTPISSLPFNITSSGSYYLAASLSGASGQSGISIQADNVTVDLEGFALVGAAGSLHGITVVSGKQNIVLYNGILRGWGGNGLDAGGALNCRIEKLMAANNTGHGLSVGANGTVSSCLAVANGGDGVRVSSACFVLDNGCNTNGVGAAGIHATGDGNRIEGNHLCGNLGFGIQVDGAANLVVKNSATFSSGTDYNIAAGSSYGQLVQSPGPSFTNATAWANFSSSCPNGQNFCSGICISLSSNPNNCGSCGNVCSLPNATSACNNGMCVIAACNSGYADCDNNPANGCEVAIVAGNNCGACGQVCNLPNATPNCVNGNCMIASCNPGYADCDANPANGCEVNILTSFNNCGGCGVVCPGGPNSTAYCSNGSCHFTCLPPYSDCNGNLSDGCEVYTPTDVNNCGGCGVVCPTVTNGTRGCSNSQCVIASCNAGWANCDGSNLNGCETNLTSSNSNCGACGNTCPVTQTCVNSACKLNNGQPCASNSQCASSICNAGFCS